MLLPVLCRSVVMRRLMGWSSVMMGCGAITVVFSVRGMRTVVVVHVLVSIMMDAPVRAGRVQSVETVCVTGGRRVRHVLRIVGRVGGVVGMAQPKRVRCAANLQSSVRSPTIKPARVVDASIPEGVVRHHCPTRSMLRLVITTIVRISKA